jgi:hypothetical protein
LLWPLCGCQLDLIGVMWKRETHSFSFQKEKAMFMRPWVSETPAMPSSPQRKALERAMS